jgi:hypothetical protein
LGVAHAESGARRSSHTCLCAGSQPTPTLLYQDDLYRCTSSAGGPAGCTQSWHRTPYFRRQYASLASLVDSVPWTSFPNKCTAHTPRVLLANFASRPAFPRALTVPRFNNLCPCTLPSAETPASRSRFLVSLRPPSSAKVLPPPFVTRPSPPFPLNKTTANARPLHHQDQADFHSQLPRRGLYTRQSSPLPRSGGSTHHPGSFLPSRQTALTDSFFSVWIRKISAANFEPSQVCLERTRLLNLVVRQEDAASLRERRGEHEAGWARAR